MKHWSQFLDHMRACDYCSKKKVQKMGRDNIRRPYEIFLEGSVRAERACRGTWTTC